MYSLRRVSRRPYKICSPKSVPSQREENRQHQLEIVQCRHRKVVGGGGTCARPDDHSRASMVSQTCTCTIERQRGMQTLSFSGHIDCWTASANVESVNMSAAKLHLMECNTQHSWCSTAAHLHKANNTCMILQVLTMLVLAAASTIKMNNE